VAGGTYRGVMRRPLLDLLQRVDPTTVIVVAALIAAPVIGFFLPSMGSGRLAIHGTAIVTSCGPKDGGWSRRSTCHGRFDPDGNAPPIEYVTFKSKRRYTAQEMLGASVASLDADEARLDKRPSTGLFVLKYALIIVPLIVAALAVRFWLGLVWSRRRSRRRVERHGVHGHGGTDSS